MDASQGYAVFFFEQALEVLGDAIKPYLIDGPAGVHVLCAEIDTGGALVEMTMAGRTVDGRAVEMELMVPSSMIRMVVSARSDGEFGFGRRDGKAQALPPIFPMPNGASAAQPLHVVAPGPTVDASPANAGDATDAPIAGDQTDASKA